MKAQVLGNQLAMLSEIMFILIQVLIMPPGILTMFFFWTFPWIRDDMCFSASVTGVEGDTLTKCFACPNGQEFKGYFDVLEKSESSTALELDYFTVKAQGSNVQLSWKTLSETENSHFVIYKNGEVLVSIDASGTCTQEKDYHYVDYNLDPGIYDYCLTAVDYSGNETRHETVSICVKESPSIIKPKFEVFPNPFNASVTLKMEFEEGNHSAISIFNTQGVLVETLFNGFMDAGYHKINWDASTMPSGIYIVRMQAGNFVSTKKLLLMK